MVVPDVCASLYCEGGYRARDGNRKVVSSEWTFLSYICDGAGFCTVHNAMQGLYHAIRRDILIMVCLAQPAPCADAGCFLFAFCLCMIACMRAAPGPNHPEHTCAPDNMYPIHAVRCMLHGAECWLADRNSDAYMCVPLSMPPLGSAGLEMA